MGTSMAHASRGYKRISDTAVCFWSVTLLSLVHSLTHSSTHSNTRVLFHSLCLSSHNREPTKRLIPASWQASIAHCGKRCEGTDHARAVAASKRLRIHPRGGRGKNTSSARPLASTLHFPSPHPLIQIANPLKRLSTVEVVSPIVGHPARARRVHEERDRVMLVDGL